MQSYNVQLSTETRHSFIVGVSVTNQQNDTQLLPAAIESVEARTGTRPERIIADNGFVTRHSVDKMADLKVELIAPLKEAGSRDAHVAKQIGIAPEFAGSRFQNDAESHCLRCPEGKALLPWKRIRKDGELKQIFAARAEDCTTCGSKPKCCPKAAARQVYRVVESAAMLAHIARMQTEAAQKLYGLRCRIAEFPHMRLKANWRLRRFSLSGLAKVATETLWMVLAYNFHQWIWAKKQVQTA